MGLGPRFPAHPTNVITRLMLTLDNYLTLTYVYTFCCMLRLFFININFKGRNTGKCGKNILLFQSNPQKLVLNVRVKLTERVWFAMM